MSQRFEALLGGLTNIVRALGATWHWPERLPAHQTVLVTGASVGVGLELARLLIERTDHRLILTARASSMVRFAEAGIHESERIRLRSMDVTSEAERDAVVMEAEADWGGVDVLVNNAGVSIRAVVEHVTEAERLHQMQVNFLAPMALTRRVLPTMRAKRAGRILNVSSVGGMSAMPTMAVYSASKFALEGASEALWYEIRPWNVYVSLVQPGFINSNGFRKVQFSAQGQRDLTDSDFAYHAHYMNMERMVERLMTLTWSTSRSVAQTLFHTMHRRAPPLRVAGTWDAWFFDRIRRLLPRSLYHLALYAGLPRVWTWGRRPHAPGSTRQGEGPSGDAPLGTPRL